MILLKVIIFLLLSFIGYQFYLVNKKTDRNGNKIPNGPFAIPILGNLLLNIGASRHLVLERVGKKFGRVYRLLKGGLFCIVVSDVEFIRQMDDSGNFNAKPLQPSHEYGSIGYNDIVFTSDQAKWGRNREYLIKSLAKVKTVMDVDQEIEEQVNNLIRAFQYHQDNNLMIHPKLYLKKLVLNVFFKMTFNKTYPYEDILSNKSDFNQEFLAKLEKKALFIDKHIGDYLERFKPKFRAFFQKARGFEIILGNLKMVKDEYNKHINGGSTNDIMGLLVELFKGGSNSVNDGDLDSLYGIILNLLEFGIEEISNTMEFVLLELINNSTGSENLQDILYQEIQSLGIQKGQYISNGFQNKTPKLNSFIKEVMRVHPIHPLVFKRCTNNTQIQNYLVQEGTCIILNYKSINNDEKYFESPNQFRYNRFIGNSGDDDANLMVYGNGARRCPGDQLSSQLIYTITINILNNFIIFSNNNSKILFKECKGSSYIIMYCITNYSNIFFFAYIDYSLTSFPSQFEIKLINRE
ncbi:hypothetical protein DICPUDRAFT_154414 [Dictyostelium purpureum]|uniref:Cytochrome P450 family protein n=1 Tax=Dictyostelium purpureum TaxID=5786 RepID=F0ZR99_DICPU|nr:uncharacterized protein DICPUDRAFT_154414 [Dictyostelium purpureum]EGC33516.1 hypothetical protein DICPUDRAFT_154414 [Dictyostelium purpureum]|eukprot:XP_003289941.1 hypothetical protein DICPUDRAFT_154414 [Dictyostelium purpureum]